MGRRFPPPAAHHLSNQSGQRPVQLLASLYGFAGRDPAATRWQASCLAIPPLPSTTTRSTGRENAASSSALYFADDWRITRKLTLNLGFRWDYYSPFSEVANRWANFNVNTAKIDIAGRNGVDKYAGVKPYYKNFGPRFGFAYQLFSHTVVRGGYGIFYNPAGNEGSSLRLFRQLPFGSTVSVSPGDINVG